MTDRRTDGRLPYPRHFFVKKRGDKKYAIVFASTQLRITRLRKYPIDPKAYLGRCLYKKFQRKIVNTFLFIILAYVMGAQKNRLIETILLSIHNICFG